MVLTLTKEHARVFRITHRDNVSWILDNGMHAQSGEVSDPNFRNIGNPELIERRTHRVIEIQPGGTLSDYIPFYFTPFSIMMFNIRTGRSVKQVPDEDIVIFVSSLPHMASCGVHFLFTNQHAYTEGADFYATPDKLEEIDRALLQARDFKRDPDDPGKLSRYMAEALVWRHVPLNALQGVCCYSPVVERQLKAEVASRRLSFNVAVQRNWYF